MPWTLLYSEAISHLLFVLYIDWLPGCEPVSVNTVYTRRSSPDIYIESDTSYLFQIDYDLPFPD